ncbi:MAG: cytochrome c biogenesis heme-transporting ATPase CcmA [Gammaproteobacteria bacterium]|nr:cytochrome c biogenesis heme-transporting ATPase CcmA [Gammaproteobacteria bacterium]
MHSSPLPQAVRKAGFSGPARLEGREIECIRGHACLFSNLEFALESGTALQILGANGTGKTSLIRIITGLTEADQGTISWNQVNIRDPGAAYAGHFSYLGHRNGLNDALTPRENLHYLGKLEASEPWLGIGDSLEQFEIGNCLDIPCARLSAGQQQRVALARVYRSPARLWVLDEPATALDAPAIGILAEIMTRHLLAGGLIVYASHQAIDLGPVTARRLQL